MDSAIVREFVNRRLKEIAIDTKLYKRFRDYGCNASSAAEYARVLTWCERREIRFAWPADETGWFERYCEMDGSVRPCDRNRCTHFDRYSYGCVAYDGKGEYECDFTYPEFDRVLASVWGIGTGNRDYIDSDYQLMVEAEEGSEAMYSIFRELFEEGAAA